MQASKHSEEPFSKLVPLMVGPKTRTIVCQNQMHTIDGQTQMHTIDGHGYHWLRIA
jgi:hypothetical protein